MYNPVVLPGGRWFLSLNGWGEISAVDMDSPQMEPQKIVEGSRYIEEPELEDSPGKFTVWVDPHAPRLTFRIGLVNPESNRRYSSMCVFIDSSLLPTNTDF